MSDGAVYTSESIQVLKGLEAVRLRPAMYIGDVGERGLHHLVNEVVDNSVDECMAGHANRIEVRVFNDGSVAVIDNGRGIPVDWHKEENKSALEVVMTMLHAGGKFDHDSYKVSGGLHGVGVSVVNALSQWCEVEVWRDGAAHVQAYRRGVPQGEVRETGKSDRRGTRVHFLPDNEIFEETEYQFDILAKRMRELAFLNRGLAIELFDERTSKGETFCYQDGISAFVRYINRSREPIHPDVVHFRAELEGVVAEVALQYTDDYKEAVFSFVNNINTHNGGTHVSGFKAALTGVLNRYGKQANLYKEEQTPQADDYHEGLTVVIQVLVPDPQFEGQTKDRLGNREVQGLVQTMTREALTEYCEEHPATAKAIINKALEAQRVRLAKKRAADLARRKSALTSGGLPGKLADCQSSNIEESELYLVEGDSAGGSAKQARERRFQAVLPLRGKILNVEKARLDKMLSHEEIQIIISALGTGLGAGEGGFDISKLRYGKVVIMTDADVDGSHIRTLLLTFFFRHMPQLIEQGHIFVAQPPLYRIKKKSQLVYAHSDAELREKLLELGSGVGQLLACRGDETRELDLGKIQGPLTALRRIRQKHEKLGLPLDSALSFAKPETMEIPVVLAEEVPLRGAEGGMRLAFYALDEYLDFLKTREARTGRPTRIYKHGDPEEFKAGAEIVQYDVKDHPALVRCLKALQEAGVDLELALGRSEWRLALRTGEGQPQAFASIDPLLDQIQELAMQGVEIQRYKGLGEMNPDQLWDTTMDPERRTMLQVQIGDEYQSDFIFTTLMGNLVEPRREFIEQHALEVRNLDV